MRVLQHEYNISKANLRDILHGKNEALVFCNKCGVLGANLTQLRKE
jgi:hypothetical protein